MFGNKKKEVYEPQEAPVVMNDITVIGEGITMHGDFETRDPIEIRGTLEGNIFSTSTVYVSKSGRIKGNGEMQVLDLEGTVNGDIKCLEVAKIASSGVLSGNLATVRLQTEDGSSFDGGLTMIKPNRTKAEDEKAVKADE